MCYSYIGRRKLMSTSLQQKYTVSVWVEVKLNFRLEMIYNRAFVVKTLSGMSLVLLSSRTINFEELKSILVCNVSNACKKENNSISNTKRFSLFAFRFKTRHILFGILKVYRP